MLHYMDIIITYCKDPYFFTTGVMESWSFFFFCVAHLAHVGSDVFDVKYSKNHTEFGSKMVMLGILMKLSGGFGPTG